ncbi:vacuolar protein sorting protein [Carpediemonas membranifera]|uniref:Vacuolar protein sorting protein n=1 Tax=Carpediemonas membranifera TaxID=201153 RepID=A0A8J6B226_9EUKA|nr:vacuolar protein sorting protein [Carpediemonas membranifera]|eukprot:KAG9397595.1 vacuolar protein sorting protein [Carpediemonas membranifera]
MEEPSDEIFSFVDVQSMHRGVSIKNMLVSQNYIFFALTDGQVLLQDESGFLGDDGEPAKEMIKLKASSKKSNEIIKMFCDPTGRHLIINAEQGLYYINTAWTGVVHKLDKRFDPNIECTGFSNRDVTDDSTGQFMVGTTDGQVAVWCISIAGKKLDDRKDRLFATPMISLRSKENNNLLQKHSVSIVSCNVQKLVTYDEDDEEVLEGYYASFITNRFLFEVLPAGAISLTDTVRAHAERHKTLIFSYQTSSDKSARSVVAVHPNNDSCDLDSIAWMADRQLLVATLAFSDGMTQAITESRTIDLPEGAISCYMTDYHVLVMTESKLYGYSTRDSTQVCAIPLEHTLTGIAGYDCDRILLYGPKNVVAIVIADEDRHQWRILMEQCKFAEAMANARTEADMHQIRERLGNHLFNQGRLAAAARCWGSCAVPVERVVPKLMMEADSTALLIVYLQTKVKYVKPSARTQLAALRIWLMECMLARMTVLELRETYAKTAAEKEQIQRDLADLFKAFRQFVEKNAASMDRRTAYDVIGAHNRPELLRLFAERTKHHEEVMALLMASQQYEGAQAYLEKITDTKMKLALIERYAGDLVEVVPYQLVTMLLSLVMNGAVTPGKLVPHLLRYKAENDLTSAEPQNVRLLRESMSYGMADSTSLHYLLTLYAQLSGDDNLLLLIGSPDARLLDMHYSLRLCKDRPKVVTRIYQALGMWKDSVEGALALGDVDQAMEIAGSTAISSSAVKKDLWTMIVRYVSQTDVSRTLEIVKSCEHLQLQDVLQFFKAFDVIDNEFKDTICESLKQYSHDSERFRKKMEVSIEASDRLRGELRSLPARRVTVPADAACSLCGRRALVSASAVFPCGHIAHLTCITSRNLDDCPVCGLGVVEDMDELFLGGADATTRGEWEVEV